MSTLIVLVILTNISSIYLAKRALTQASEAAAQRGVRNLDKTSYYRGEFDATTQARNLFGIGPSDPGVPIDCSKALGDAEGALALKQRRTHRTYTPQFKAELVAMCQKPGASIAAVALQHGMNANLLHRWRKEWAQGLHRLEGGITTTVATPQTPAFIPIELSHAAYARGEPMLTSAGGQG